jgi:hypothetical protein
VSAAMKVGRLTSIARRAVRVNRPYLFRRLAQNDDLAHQIAQTRFGLG